jgi:hypothetical protein
MYFLSPVGVRHLTPHVRNSRHSTPCGYRLLSRHPNRRLHPWQPIDRTIGPAHMLQLNTTYDDYQSATLETAKQVAGYRYRYRQHDSHVAGSEMHMLKQLQQRRLTLTCQCVVSCHNCSQPCTPDRTSLHNTMRYGPV